VGKTESEESGKDIGNAHGSPEKGKTNRHLVVFIKVGEIEDDLVHQLV
jgi:hypothetical protein